LLLSLATAGYGTALGVIRALHSEGVLQRAYCTETRPFNQVSPSFPNIVIFDSVLSEDGHLKLLYFATCHLGLIAWHEAKLEDNDVLIFWFMFHLQI
jgi:hypothetical protein